MKWVLNNLKQSAASLALAGYSKPVTIGCNFLALVGNSLACIDGLGCREPKYTVLATSDCLIRQKTPKT